MGAAIVGIIPYALGKMIAVNPTIAVIILLMSEHGRDKAFAYICGAIIGPMIAGTALLALAGTVSVPHSDHRALLASVVQLLIAVVFLFLAYRTGRQLKAESGSDATLPDWLRAIERVNGTGALGLGALMTVIGVKNLLMLTGGLVVINSADLPFLQSEIVLVVFVAISTIPVASPLVMTHVLGPRGDEVLSSWKAWLVRNSALVMMGLFLLFGVYFLVQGLGGLLHAHG